MSSDDPQDDKGNNNLGFDFEKLLQKYRIPIFLVLLGAILIGLGIIYVNREPSSSGIEIIEKNSEVDAGFRMLVIEVAGAVENPGVYEMDPGKRVEDALSVAGGITSDADTVWMEKVLNRAAKITDGQKIYIPTIDENNSKSILLDKQSDVLSAKESGLDQSGSSTFDTNENKMVNINTASSFELEALWGIGPVTAQNIIEQRMYSNIEELLRKGILKRNVYERNKELLTVY